MTDSKENNKGCGYGIWIILGFLVIMAIAMPEEFFSGLFVYLGAIAVMLGIFWFVSQSMKGS